MMARTHVALGMGAALLALDAGWLPADPASVVGALAGAAVGSLLPDIDHPHSTFGRAVPMVSRPLSAIFGHRGITHSLIAVVGCVLAGDAAASWEAWSAGISAAGLGLAMGYLSHLAADAFNPSGVPLLYPSRKRFRFPLTFRPGGLLESLFFFGVLGFAAWSLLARLSMPHA